MAQYQARTGPIVNDAAPFVPSMVQADRPSIPFRFSSRNGQGWSVSQTTHVAAPFQSAMAEASRPSTSRAWIAPRLGRIPSINETIVAASTFSIEMTYAMRPVEPVLPLINRAGWVTAPPDVTRFVDEALFGKRPETSRAVPATRGPSFFPWSGTPAPFGPEMAAGAHPDSGRAWLPFRTGWSQRDATQVVAAPFSPEMVDGWHPDSARVTLGPKLPQPWSQTTHVAAPVTSDMSAGAKPDQGRQGKVQGGGAWLTPEVLTFSIEMAQGWHPDSNRQFLAPRLLFPLSQTSHTPAPVTTDMLAGAHPDQSRQGKLQRGQAWWPPDVDAFSIEMVVGYHPDRARFFMGPRTVGWQTSQLTHTAAPFSAEMVLGHHPDLPRLFKKPQLGWYTFGVDAILIVYVVSDAALTSVSAGPARVMALTFVRSVDDWVLTSVEAQLAHSVDPGTTRTIG